MVRGSLLGRETERDADQTQFSLASFSGRKTLLKDQQEVNTSFFLMTWLFFEEYGHVPCIRPKHCQTDSNHSPFKRPTTSQTIIPDKRVQLSFLTALEVKKFILAGPQFLSRRFQSELSDPP